MFLFVFVSEDGRLCFVFLRLGPAEPKTALELPDGRWPSSRMAGGQNHNDFTLGSYQMQSRKRLWSSRMARMAGAPRRAHKLDYFQLKRY